jgi:serine protease
MYAHMKHIITTLQQRTSHAARLVLFSAAALITIAHPATVNAATLATASISPSYVNDQRHLKDAPIGAGVYAHVGDSDHVYPGSQGSLVKVVDLEYAWNTGHEDLSQLRQSDTAWTNGTPAASAGNTDAGAAATGVLVGDRNAFGITGIVPRADYHTMNVNNKERGYDIGRSIRIAADKMATGDIMLINQQWYAPGNKGFVPIEFLPQAYDAIRYATSKGITVIEPAGNGKSDASEGYNLDDPMFKGAFTTKKSSGAIIVGAGSSGCQPGIAAQSRMPYSNYGSRIDMQAHGDCVMTAGYGYGSKANPNASYNKNYGATGSAAAIVAGLAAELSSSYEHVNKTGLKPSLLRAYLRTGTQPQNTSRNPGNIGGMPNMANALNRIDTAKPTAPSGMTMTNATAPAGNFTPLFKWKASSDNLGYVRYNIYRDGQFLKQVSEPTYTDTQLTDGQSYTYRFVAIDASNNEAVLQYPITAKK